MNGKNLKIWSAEVLEKSEADEAQTGQILRADKNGLLVQTRRNVPEKPQPLPEATL